MPPVSNQYRNVCDVIVPSQLCVGCGICAGICLQGAINIEWNHYGEYTPVEQTGKCNECGLCLQVCPFWNQQENETTLAEREFKDQNEIQHNCVLGLFLDVFAGYSKVDNHRIRGAGGGLTTWLLESLLTQRLVNRVCCVVPNNHPNTLFRYSVVDRIEDIRSASRSAYYPVELSQTISEILSVDGRYAVVGLPCVLKGLRLAMLHNVDLRKRIVVLAGLVCGQQKSKFFAEYLCAMSGGRPSELKSASFRVKDPDRHHLDHRFEFTCGSGDEVVTGHIYQSQGMSWLWGHDCFKLNACNFCDDITAEVADVTFGDAVAESYSYGNMGANFVIVRSGLIRDLFASGASAEEIVLEQVPLEAITARQQGAILLKRNDLRHRVWMMHHKNSGSYIPVKRFRPCRWFNPLDNLDMAVREQIAKVSRNTYAKYKHQPDVVFQVESAIRRVFETLAYHNWIFNLFYFMVGFLKSMKCQVRGLIKRLRELV